MTMEMTPRSQRHKLTRIESMRPKCCWWWCWWSSPWIPSATSWKLWKQLHSPTTTRWCRVLIGEVSVGFMVCLPCYEARTNDGGQVRLKPCDIKPGLRILYLSDGGLGGYASKEILVDSTSAEMGPPNWGNRDPEVFAFWSSILWHVTCLSPTSKKETLAWTVQYDIVSCYHGCSVPHEVSLWATVVTFSLAKYTEIILNTIYPIGTSTILEPTILVKSYLSGLVMSRVCPIQVRHQGLTINCRSQPSWVLTTSFLRPRRIFFVVSLGTTHAWIHMSNVSCYNLQFDVFAVFFLLLFAAVLRTMAFTCMYIIHYISKPSINFGWL